MRFGLTRGCLAVVMVGLMAAMWGGERAVAQPCEPEWAEGVFPAEGVSGRVFALAEFDDGTGMALYVAGDFAAAGGESAPNIARWDGSVWTAVGDGLDESVRDLVVFDDGSGPALYAAGVRGLVGGACVARWDGSAWTALSGLWALEPTRSEVETLAVYDDGSGPALYAGGNFNRADGQPVNYVARWNGASWVVVGDGLSTSRTDGTARSLAVFDDGTGPALYAAGDRLATSGFDFKSLVRWDGSAWTAVEESVNARIFALEVFDDGTGPSLYAGGSFTTASGNPANRIARFDGTVWTPLGEGVAAGRPTPAVYSLGVFDDGSGPALYVGGDFAIAGTAAANNIARWDGVEWAPLGEGLAVGPGLPVLSLAVFDDGDGSKLYAGGNIVSAGGETASHVAAWDGAAWEPLGEAVNDHVAALTTFDDGAGPALYAGGAFTAAGGIAANHIARWDGENWTPLGEGFAGTEFYTPVLALAAYDDGSGPALYAAGDFSVAGGVEAHNIARWDGSAWTPLGEGLTRTFSLEAVFALAVFDDGTGPALYAGGQFNRAGGIPATGIARWDGSAWTPVGSGLDGWAMSMAVFDDGSGPALYVAGRFASAGGQAASSIAKWDGTAWTPLGGGLRDPWGIASVYSLEVFDDGTRPALYAGGNFVTAGDVQALYIARWDGSAWSPVGLGMRWGIPDVKALAVFDDGTGSALYAGGGFSFAGGVEVNQIARWDGSVWSPIGSGTVGTGGLSGRVDSLAVYDDGAGPALFVGGDFINAGGVPSGHLARWGCITEPCPADLDGDGELTIFDFLMFQNLFDAGDPIADFDGDGELTIFDFLAFQNAFDAGCG